MRDDTDQQVVFVCQHGAFRSRIAAAYFNAAATAGWSAISAGVTPQTEVSPRLGPLMAGTGVEEHIDASPPRSLGDRAAARVIAIDVNVAGAETWRIGNAATDEELREEIRKRVERLVAEVEERPAL